MESQEKNINQRVYKWAIVLFAVVMLIAGTRLMLKSDWLFNKIRGIVVEQATNQLNGTLEVGSIRGDLLNGFTLTEVQLHGADDEKIASVDSVTVSYRLFSLIRSPYTIDDLKISGVDAFVSQDQDSVWNVMKLVEQDTTETDPVFWSVDNMNLDQININVESDYLLPDGFLNIKNLSSSTSIGVKETGFTGILRSLEFQIEEARLPETIEVYLAGAAQEGNYTLESLLINTGRTLLNAKATVEGESEVMAQLDLAPLSWRDLALYVNDLPLEQDVSVDISAEGSMENLSLSLAASAGGLSQLNASAIVGLTGEQVLKSVELSIENLDVPLLTGIENAPIIDRLSLNGSGSILLENPALSEWNGELEIEEFRFEEYGFDDFRSEFNLIEDQFTFDATIIYQDEEVGLVASASNIWDEKPGWNTTVNSRNLNLSTWLNNSELDSDLTILAELSGSGISLEDFDANTNITITDSRFNQQPFTEISFEGNISPARIDGFLQSVITESELSADFNVSDWQDTPGYSFNLALERFNMAELTGFEDFPTRLNGVLEGEGISFDPESIQLSASAEFDSSFVNREEIETLSARFRVEESFLYVDGAQLESPIADAQFSLKQHIVNFTDTENTLQFLASLKDLQALAPLFGLERLESQGTIAGQIARATGGTLQFNGEIDFTEVLMDSLFRTERILGDFRANLTEVPEVEVNVELIKPFVNEIGVQDVTFNTTATLGEVETTGRIGYKIINDENNSISQQGEFSVDSSRVWLRTNQLDFSTELRTLSLVEPFNITYAGNILQVDTLMIQSPGENAYLKLWAPHVDSLKQHAGLDAKNVNLGALQTTVIDEALFEGLLSANIEIFNDPDRLEVAATGLMSELRYESGTMDSLRFNLELQEEWLTGSLNSWHEDAQLFSGDLRVPFIPGDPLTFDDQFFDQEVEGSFELSETNLSYWLSFLPDNQIEETDGTISFSSDLSGIAGNPELNGNLLLKEARLSGIQIDSVDMDLIYLHENEHVEFDGLVTAQQEPIVDFDARLPFKVDLRTAEILLPEDDDSVDVNIKTDDLNLALLNDFVDREMIRQIRGRLNGNISIRGELADLNPEGRMELTNGSMRVVPSGTTLNNIRSVINFNPDRVDLESFSMESGPGSIRASGSIEIENLEPGTLELNIRGNQFRAANTSEYNAIIDLSADLTGTIEEPTITGNLTFLNGFVNLQNFGESSVEDVQLEDEEEPEPVEFYEAMAVEMNVNFAREFYIRNRQFLDMEIELGGEVDLVKERYNDLQMFGSLEGVQGYARPLGKNFELDEAVVTFSGPIENPALNIITQYEPPQGQTDVRIFYIIEGTVQDPDFRFGSEPELELQDIISYTLFGKPFYELESWEQVVAGSGSGPSATDLALDVLLDRVETLASQRLGIDVVQIDNSRTGSNSTTSIKTGWYLNRRTFFAILNEISSTRPKTLFMLEYMLMDNLELIITQGDDSREGIDLKWQYDY